MNSIFAVLFLLGCFLTGPAVSGSDDSDNDDDFEILLGRKRNRSESPPQSDSGSATETSGESYSDNSSDTSSTTSSSDDSGESEESFVEGQHGLHRLMIGITNVLYARKHERESEIYLRLTDDQIEELCDTIPIAFLYSAEGFSIQIRSVLERFSKEICQVPKKSPTKSGDYRDGSFLAQWIAESIVRAVIPGQLEELENCIVERKRCRYCGRYRRPINKDSDYPNWHQKRPLHKTTCLSEVEDAEKKHKRRILKIERAVVTNGSHTVRPIWSPSDGDCAFHALSTTRRDFLTRVREVIANPAHPLHDRFRELFVTQAEAGQFTYETWLAAMEGGAPLWAGEFELNLLGWVYNQQIQVFTRGNGDRLFRRQHTLGDQQAPEVWIAHVANAYPGPANHYIRLEQAESPIAGRSASAYPPGLIDSE